MKKKRLLFVGTIMDKLVHGRRKFYRVRWTKPTPRNINESWLESWVPATAVSKQSKSRRK